MCVIIESSGRRTEVHPSWTCPCSRVGPQAYRKFFRHSGLNSFGPLRGRSRIYSRGSVGQASPLQFLRFLKTIPPFDTECRS